MLGQEEEELEEAFCELIKQTPFLRAPCVSSLPHAKSDFPSEHFDWYDRHRGSSRSSGGEAICESVAGYVAPADTNLDPPISSIKDRRNDIVQLEDARTASEDATEQGQDPPRIPQHREPPKPSKQHFQQPRLEPIGHSLAAAEIRENIFCPEQTPSQRRGCDSHRLAPSLPHTDMKDVVEVTARILCPPQETEPHHVGEPGEGQLRHLMRLDTRGRGNVNGTERVVVAMLTPAEKALLSCRAQKL
ncbi:hypothetical protein CYMTET_20159, partial [Cymbomonas tetramitiformis]